MRTRAGLLARPKHACAAPRPARRVCRLREEGAQDGFSDPHRPREEGVRPRSVPTAQVPGRGSGPLQIPGDDGQSIASRGHQAGHRPADASGASEHGAHLVHLGRGASGLGKEATRDGPSQRPRKFTQRGTLKLNRGATAPAAGLEGVRAQKLRAPQPPVTLARQRQRARAPGGAPPADANVGRRDSTRAALHAGTCSLGAGGRAWAGAGREGLQAGGLPCSKWTLGIGVANTLDSGCCGLNQGRERQGLGHEDLGYVLQVVFG